MNGSWMGVFHHPWITISLPAMLCDILYNALTFLKQKKSYVRLLFIDYSPHNPITKLNNPGLNTHLCNSILSYLAGRPQTVYEGKHISSSITLNTGVPQGCVLCVSSAPQSALRACEAHSAFVSWNSLFWTHG